MYSFLMIGQSNMAGRGFVHEAEPIQNSKLHVLRNGDPNDTQTAL